MRLMLWLLLCAPAWSAEREAPVAKLDGVVVVTEGGLADWQAAQACYGEGAPASRNAGIVRLLETAIVEKALGRAGTARISKRQLAEEAARIDRETRAPEILSCMKKGLQGKRYLEAFVRPILVEARLRSFLQQDGPRRKVEAAIRKARQEPLEKAAREFGLTYSRAAYSLAGSEEEKRFIEANLRALKPGALGKEPIESESDFKAVRLLKKEGERWAVETAYAPKLDQAEWLKSVPKMKLEILDEGLRGWVKGIKGNPRLAAAEVQ